MTRTACCERSKIATQLQVRDPDLRMSRHVALCARSAQAGGVLKEALDVSTQTHSPPRARQYQLWPPVGFNILNEGQAVTG
jgi:hypothetical protein